MKQEFKKKKERERVYGGEVVNRAVWHKCMRLAPGAQHRAGSVSVMDHLARTAQLMVRSARLGSARLGSPPAPGLPVCLSLSLSLCCFHYIFFFSFPSGVKPHSGQIFFQSSAVVCLACSRRPPGILVHFCSFLLFLKKKNHQSFHTFL